MPATPYDVDGNGVADLVVGVPGEDFGAVADTGLVTVVLSGPPGVGSSATSWSQDTPYVQSVAERGDRFGAPVSSGDFDRDGYADLAVGAPGEDGGAGAVTVLHGSPQGLTDRDQLWTQDSPGIAGAAEAADGFGTSLAAGDLDGDGRGDLAVGVPGEDVAGPSGDERPYLDGAVALLRGAPGGLTALGDQFLHQDVPGVPGETRSPDRFGAAVALDDVDGDGQADLAASPGVPRGPEAGDAFGASVQLVDLGRLDQADLVVGLPGEDDGSGLVHVLYGGASGITTCATTSYTQASAGIPGTLEDGDGFAVLGP